MTPSNKMVNRLVQKIGQQAQETAEMLSFKQCRNIALTGIAGGGKTVFLTSILSHLAEFGQGAFHLGKGIEITDYRAVSSRRKWPQEFRYDDYREDLARGCWPEKTTDCSSFVCEFKRSDRRLRTQKLSFFDFPGERVADAAIAAFADYTGWSDHMLNHFSRHHGYREAAGPYLKYMDENILSEQVVLGEYCLTLARLILDYKPLISPSTFLLDSAGQPASFGTAAEISARRAAGIDFSRQFAPLSRKARADNPELARKMSRIYREYRKNIVLPVFENISRADTMVILVDIPSLLAGGVGRYNDNRRILLDLCQGLRSGSFIGSLLGRYLGFWGKSLKRVALVAAKADLVHPMDIDNQRMFNLLQMMTDRVGRMLPRVSIKRFVCSACHSTYALKNQHRLRGKLAYENPGREFREYAVSELPEVWPDKWVPGEFSFYRVYPDAPQNFLIPPRHRGLDQVFEFIAG
ncbi:MAG: YcjX family protein [Desulfonatronovibrionaceae bacterium]